MNVSALDPATLDLATPEHYERHGYPHAEWTWLRRHDPVFWYERPNVDPFWAITKHADIIEIGKQPDLFLNAPRLAVFTNDLPPPPEGPSRHLLNMDPPEHAPLPPASRSGWFTPRAIRGMDDEGRARRRARCSTTAAGERRGRLRARRLGADHDRGDRRDARRAATRDWNLLFRWTNEIIAPAGSRVPAGGTPRRRSSRRASSCSRTSTSWSERAPRRARRTTS